MTFETKTIIATALGYACIAALLVLLVTLTACSASAQVPPMLEEYKDADWEVEGDVLLWHNADGDTVRVYQGGGRAEGKIDGETVAGCYWTGLFSPDTLGTLATQAIETGSGYGENEPLQSLTHCIQLTAHAKDSVATE